MIPLIHEKFIMSGEREILVPLDSPIRQFPRSFSTTDNSIFNENPTDSDDKGLREDEIAKRKMDVQANREVLSPLSFCDTDSEALQASPVLPVTKNRSMYRKTEYERYLDMHRKTDYERYLDMIEGLFSKKYTNYTFKREQSMMDIRKTSGVVVPETVSPTLLVMKKLSLNMISEQSLFGCYPLRDIQYCNIVETPSTSSQKSFERKVIDRTKIRPRRLFAKEDDKKCMSKESTNEIMNTDVPSREYTVPRSRVCFMQTLLYPDRSPILSGNKRLQTKLHIENHNETILPAHTNIHQSIPMPNSWPPRHLDTKNDDQKCTSEKNRNKNTNMDIPFPRSRVCFMQKLLYPDKSPILSGNRLQTESHVENHNETILPAHTNIHQSMPMYDIWQSKTFNLSALINSNFNSIPDKNNVSDESRSENFHPKNLDTKNSDDTSLKMHIINKVLSMDMTEIYDTWFGRRQTSLLLNKIQCKDTADERKEKFESNNTERTDIICTSKSKNANSVDKVIVQNNSTISHANIIKSQNISSKCGDATVPMQSQNKRQCSIIFDSNESIRSSLNVNTSLDANSVDKVIVQNNSTISHANIIKSQNISSKCGDATVPMQSQNKRQCSIIFDSNESIRSSLNVNTSLDANSVDKVIVQNNSTISHANIIKSQNISSKCGNATVPMQSQNKRRCSIIFDSNGSIRSSLSVNTILDEILHISRKQTRQALQAIFDEVLGVTSNKKLTLSSNNRESVNSIRSSLQVNTSVDSIRKDDQRKNSSETLPKDYAGWLFHFNVKYLDFLDKKIGQAEMLDVINCWQESGFFNYEECKKFCKDESFFQYIKWNNISERHEKKYEKTKDRSIFLYTMDNIGTHLTSLMKTNNGKDNDKAKPDILSSTPVSHRTRASSKILIMKDDTVILGNILSLFIQEKSRSIKNALDKVRYEINNKNTASQNTECVTVKKRRRKLFPLNENSQLYSITPLEEHNIRSNGVTNVTSQKIKHTDTPEMSVKSTCLTEKENKDMKQSKKKLTDPKNNPNDVKCNIAKKQVCSDKDHDITKNKKKADKKTQKSKKVVSKKIVIKKFADEDMLNISRGSKRKRDSLPASQSFVDDFVKRRIIPNQYNSKYCFNDIVIVMSGLSERDQILVRNVVKSLGIAKLERRVSKRTTHVVSSGLCTINLFRGIIRGCWLVTLDWIRKSLKSKEWVNPEQFEMKDYAKAVLENRKDRQLCGSSYNSVVFITCGHIYVDPETKLYDTLKELIQLAGGLITENPKYAKITVGGDGLKDAWVLDSIKFGELQPTLSYRRDRKMLRRIQ